MTSATYVLIHGAGDSGWYWHLVDATLRERGHDVVVMDLPVEDDAAGLSEYTNVVVEAVDDRRDLVVVAQSFGGYIAPIVCDRLAARLLVLVAGMVPSPGESAEEMFASTGYTQENRRTAAIARSSIMTSPRGWPPRRSQGGATVGHPGQENLGR